MTTDEQSLKMQLEDAVESYLSCARQLRITQAEKSDAEAKLLEAWRVIDIYFEAMDGGNVNEQAAATEALAMLVPVRRLQAQIDERDAVQEIERWLSD